MKGHLFRLGLLALAVLPAIEAAEPHWSLRPLVKPALPGDSDHPIDGFIDARLAEEDLQRAPQADRRTLIRRLSFGLTGLPPTPEEVRAFVSDEDPRAYGKLLDRLLASPRYGEHWARHWLDVAHYADTHGNDHDYRRPNAWPYRDYVIRALNEDKPYSRFVEEQVGGDFLYPDSPDATIALGFLAAGPWDDTLMITIRPDTIDHKISQNLDRDGMVSAVMGTFQSLTVHCARCHDHKFDPVSQHEYYALQAVFSGCDRADRPVDADPALHARRSALRERKLAIKRRDPQLLATLDSPEVEARVAGLTERVADDSARWKMIEITAVKSSETNRTVFTPEEDGSWFVSGDRPARDTFVVQARTGLTGIRALKLEVLPDERLPVGGPGRYDNGNFHLAEFRATAKALDEAGSPNETALKFTGAIADHSDRGDAVGNTLDGNPDTYWSIHPHYGKPHEAVFLLSGPAGFDGGTSLSISLQFTGKDGHQIGRFRLWASSEDPGKDGGLAPALPTELVDLLRIPPTERSPAQQETLALAILERETDRDLAALPEPKMVYAVTHDFPARNGFTPALTPRPIHLLHRGDLNQPRELVGPGALRCLPGLPGELAISNELDESSRRAALARWLTDERNVLTWRSIANRVWHWHFGRGLCETPNDFGAMGVKPSHPELLDWLAVWFRDEAKGSLKQLHRLILTSGTYRQQVLDDPGLVAARLDSDNRLLWRMNRQRLRAEQVRDAALHLSGELDGKMGGPPALHFLHKDDKTFNPGGAPPFVDYANLDQDSPDTRRRAIYRFIFRTVPDPLMDALGCPDGGSAVPVRATSSTAQQALAMLNDAFLIRRAERLAERIVSENTRADAAAQVRAAFGIVLQREPAESETRSFHDHLSQHGLANACHLLLNSNEFLFLD